MKTRDKLTLIILIFMSIFLFADQRIMSAILPELSEEYGVGEKALGFIGSAFTLVGAFVSIFFGYFTDRISRKKLLMITVVVGEIPCLLTGVEMFTPDIYSFTLLRVLTGIGIGGIYPITFSLISDYFSEEHRATASAWLGVSWAVGMLAGPALAGYLTGTYGWRIAFILAAVPNFPLVLIFWFLAAEPKRGQTEKALASAIDAGAEYNEKIQWSDFKVLFANKTNLWTFLQGIPGTIPWGILGYWMLHFFEKTRGMSKEAATTVFLLLGVGATVGGITFAMLGDRLYRKDPRKLPIMCGTFILLGIIPALYIVNWKFFKPDPATTNLVYALAFAAGFMVAVASANVKAILMNVNRPEHRGSVFAIFNITDNLGQGFGPAIGGLLVPLGYEFMMNFAVLWWIPCGLAFFMIARYLKSDRDSLQELLKSRAASL